MDKTSLAYIKKLTGQNKAVTIKLGKIIDAALPKAENKLWHGSPVWFLDGNPIVSVTKLKAGIQLMFFSGQSFKEKDLYVVGSLKFKAAGAMYTHVNEVKPTVIKRWLKKAKIIQWDYKNIVKRKGKLVRMK